MSDKYYIANLVEMDKRKKMAQEFYNDIFDPEDMPFIVTDEATLYDIYLGDELELIEKINKKYRVSVNLGHFKIPFWKFLDFLVEDHHKK